MIKSKRLVILTIDLPYPPNYGHKVDQFNRWKGFADQGWDLRLICWRAPLDPPSEPEHVAALRDVFSSIEILPIRHDPASFAMRLARLPRLPSHVSARVPNRVTTARLTREAVSFAPDAIILDNIYPGWLAERLAAACGVPLILRGHNVEHVYFKQQSRAVTDLRSRVAWGLARIGLERYERRMISRARWVFDVSADDVAFWRGQGASRISWAPTVFPGAASGTILPPASRQYDVAYIGNLRLPNNLQGIAWFVREVLPELRRLRPGVTLCFAGANPGGEAKALFAEAPDILLIPDAPSADDILSNGRVLLNPILSGSGINVKSIDMLRYDAPIVTTRVGAQGFDPSMAGQFVVRDEPQAFAAAIAEALENPLLPAGREDARKMFGQAGLLRQITDYERVIAGGSPTIA